MYIYIYIYIYIHTFPPGGLRPGRHPASGRELQRGRYNDNHKSNNNNMNDDTIDDNDNTNNDICRYKYKQT